VTTDYNGSMSIQNADGGGAPMADIKYPANTVLLHERVRGMVYNVNSFTDYQWIAINERGSSERHSGGSNFALADGHAKWYKVAAPAGAPSRDGVSSCGQIGLDSTKGTSVWWNLN